jgi:hypothetical protein
MVVHRKFESPVGGSTRLKDFGEPMMRIVGSDSVRRAGVTGCMLAAAILVTGCVSFAFAAEDSPTKDASATAASEKADTAAAKLRANLDASVEWNEFAASDGESAEFQAHLAHRWTNNERDPNGQGVLVVWSAGGRPRAFASIYPWAGNLVHELETISRTPFVMSRDGAVTWKPTSGLTFRPIPGASEPNAKPVARLREMKELADRFEVTMLGWNADDSDRERLRRLPKEFFRHKPESREVLDGAVFGFVKGTDPEALLIVEAVPGADANSPAKYEFAFARATSGALEARLGDDVVWAAAKHPQRRDPSGLSFSIGRPLGQ